MFILFDTGGKCEPQPVVYPMRPVLLAMTRALSPHELNLYVACESAPDQSVCQILGVAFGVRPFRRPGVDPDIRFRPSRQFAEVT